MERIENQEEQLAKQAFNTQAPVFDDLYTNNPIIQYKRLRVRNLVLQYLKPGNKILELNAGSGEDAIFFARNGCFVHATDISDKMQKELQRKAVNSNVDQLITTQLCSFTNLVHLNNKGPYDLIFSNFAGLNCTDKLDQVLLSFSHLLKPGGHVILTILPPFCLWETTLAFKGNFKSAFRRFFSSKGAAAEIEGVHFKCWYYQPQYIMNVLKTDFILKNLEGLCTIVPPSYIENFPLKYPKLYRTLVRLENKLKSTWPWKGIGDYYIICLQKK